MTLRDLLAKATKWPHVDVCERCKVIARIDAIMEGRDDG